MARHDFIHTTTSQRGTDHQSGHSLSSTQRSNSSWSQSQTPHSGTRSPSPAPELAVDNMTGPQIGRDIARIKEFISQHISSSPDTDSTQQPKKKRKVASPTQRGRGIRKVIDLYHELPDVVTKANKHMSMSELEPEEIEEALCVDFVGLTEGQIEEELKDRKRCHTAMLLLDKLIPGFQEKVNTSDDVNSLCSLLMSGANDARSDDTSRLKAAVANWLNCDMCCDEVTGPSSMLSATHRRERGISNDVTGRLLCPIEYDWDDLQVRAKLRDVAPGYDYTSNYFLRCLYHNEKGDPENPEEGFLRGGYLLRTYRHIFTSPSSASQDPEHSRKKKVTSRRRDVANTLRLDGQVTPRSIAYAATQLIFALDSAPEWVPEHCSFHYCSFYNFIVDYFEENDNADDDTIARMNELLVWWNSKVFPDRNSQSAGGVASNATKSSQQKIQEARARRSHAA